MKARLSNYRQAPRKVRNIVNVVRGKRVSDAIQILSTMPRRGALPVKKLIESALANAKIADSHTSADTLTISKITVDKGLTMMRSMPRARGRATPIHKETSHVVVELAPLVAPIAKTAVVKKARASKTTTSKTGTAQTS